MEILWRGHAQGNLEVGGPPRFVAESVSQLLNHLRARAETFTEDELALLGACAMYMALREARFAKASFVIGAAEKILDSFYPVLSPDWASQAFGRGTARLIDHLLPIRGADAHVLIDKAFSYLSAWPGWRAA